MRGSSQGSKSSPKNDNNKKEGKEEGGWGEAAYEKKNQGQQPEFVGHKFWQTRKNFMH
jgi:hypothetical protein